LRANCDGPLPPSWNRCCGAIVLVALGRCCARIGFAARSIGARLVVAAVWCQLASFALLGGVGLTYRSVCTGPVVVAAFGRMDVERGALVRVLGAGG